MHSLHRSIEPRWFAMRRACLILLSVSIAWLSALQSDAPAQTVKASQSHAAPFGGLAEGPYKRLVILNAMVIPGDGGPPTGPWDIVVERNIIAEITSPVPDDSDPSLTASGKRKETRPTGDRVIDATGMYVMPGLIDLHTHVRTEPLPLEYIYLMKLANGVTTIAHHPDRGLESAIEQARLSAENKILAPRIFPYWPWEFIPGHTRQELEDPKQAGRIATEIKAKGMRVVSMDGWGWVDNALANPELFAAVCHAVSEAGGITTVHLQPEITSVMNAVDAARLGVTMIEHHYGYAESSLNQRVQDFPRNYNYSNEADRFRQAGKVWTEANRERLLTDVAQKLVDYGVTMLPTQVAYEANRDVLRAASLPWHEKYTHQYILSNAEPGAGHAAYHWDWTSDDEAYWSTTFELWGKLIFEFNKRGGRVAYGTDDPFMWNAPGFSNIRELQLSRETGVHALEVLKFATYNSALTLREPDLGLVRTGYKADLLLVDGNPAYNLEFLYAFGALTTDKNGRVYRTRGIVNTIKDGIVIDNSKAMERVQQIVADSKRDVGKPSVFLVPFVTEPRKPRSPH
jgi:hypothetical protein